MLWDLYIVADHPRFRVTPKTAVHLLRTLITDGRVTRAGETVTDSEDPEIMDDVLFWAEAGEMGHTVFYDGPRIGAEHAFERFEFQVLSQAQPLPAPAREALGIEETELYWCWLKFTGARFNFMSPNMETRLKDAIQMTARAAVTPHVPDAVHSGTEPSTD